MKCILVVRDQSVFFVKLNCFVYSAYQLYLEATIIMKYFINITDNGECAQTCTNNYGSFECSCRSGYTKSEL